MPFAGVKIHSLRGGAVPIDGYRQDLVAGDVITLSLTDTDGMSTFQWQLLGRPEGSVAGGVGPEPISLGAASTATFTVDTDAGIKKDGTYIVACVVNAGADSETRITTALIRLNVRALADGRALRRIGGFEAAESDLMPTLPSTAQGWATMLNRWLAYVDELAGAGAGADEKVKVDAADTMKSYLYTAGVPATSKIGAGAGVTLSVTVGGGGEKTLVIAAPGVGHAIENGGVALPQRPVLNFVTGFTLTDVGAAKTQVDLEAVIAPAGPLAYATITVDAYGRVTAAAAGAAFTDKYVAYDAADTPGYLDPKLLVTANQIKKTLSAGPVKTLTLGLDDLLVDPSGSYTLASITVDKMGRVTAAASGAAPTGDHKVLAYAADADPAAYLDGKLLGTANQITATAAANKLTLSLTNYGAGAATYAYPRSVVVDAKGRITSITAGGGAEGTAGGDLKTTYPNPQVIAATTQNGAGDRLVWQTVTDGEFVKRVGLTLVSAAPPGDHLVKGAAVDNTPNHLAAKIFGSASILVTSTGGPADAILTLTAIGAPPSGAAGGDLSGTYPNPRVTQITDGTAAHLAIGTIAANGYLTRNGASQIVSVATIPFASISGFTNKSIPFADAGGLLTQDATFFTYDTSINQVSVVKSGTPDAYGYAAAYGAQASTDFYGFTARDNAANNEVALGTLGGHGLLQATGNIIFKTGANEIFRADSNALCVGVAASSSSSNSFTFGSLKTKATAGAAVWDAFAWLGTGTYSQLTLTGAGTVTQLAFANFTASPVIFSSSGPTVTDAATLRIGGPPIGSGVTITNAWSFWVDDGLSRFDAEAWFKSAVYFGSASIPGTALSRAMYEPTNDIMRAGHFTALRDQAEGTNTVGTGRLSADHLDLGYDRQNDGPCDFRMNAVGGVAGTGDHFTINRASGINGNTTLASTGSGALILDAGISGSILLGVNANPCITVTTTSVLTQVSAYWNTISVAAARTKWDSATDISYVNELRAQGAASPLTAGYAHVTPNKIHIGRSRTVSGTSTLAFQAAYTLGSGNDVTLVADSTAGTFVLQSNMAGTLTINSASGDLDLQTSSLVRARILAAGTFWHQTSTYWNTTSVAAARTYWTSASDIFFANELHVQGTVSPLTTGQTIITTDDISIGAGRTVSGTSGITFSSLAASGLSASIYRQSGINGQFNFYNTGTGRLSFEQADAGDIDFLTDALRRMQVAQDGVVFVGAGAPLAGGPVLQVTKGGADGEALTRFNTALCPLTVYEDTSNPVYLALHQNGSNAECIFGLYSSGITYISNYNTTMGSVQVEFDNSPTAYFSSKPYTALLAGADWQSVLLTSQSSISFTDDIGLFATLRLQSRGASGTAGKTVDVAATLYIDSAPAISTMAVVGSEIYSIYAPAGRVHISNAIGDGYGLIVGSDHSYQMAPINGNTAIVSGGDITIWDLTSGTTPRSLMFNCYWDVNVNTMGDGGYGGLIEFAPLAGTFTIMTSSAAHSHAVGLTMREHITVYPNGNITLGYSDPLATNATAGFPYIPSCAGTPTGLASEYGNRVAMVFDTTNNRMYFRNPVTNDWRYCATV